MELDSLEKNLNFIFKNKNLLIQAISHKSYSLNHNERLEFLGDSVLNFIITKYIYKKYPYFKEGDMTKIRSYLIKSNILVKISKKIGIHKFINTKNLENLKFIPDSIIENTFESIIAAMYLDQGLKITEKFILNKYSKYLNLIYKYSLKIIKDSKTTLQEISQKFFFSFPVYNLRKVINDINNKKKFFVTCTIIKNNYYFIKSAIGNNKKNAEKLSARKMISFIKYKKLI